MLLRPRLTLTVFLMGRLFLHESRREIWPPRHVVWLEG